jgi:hypothetical protein
VTTACALKNDRAMGDRTAGAAAVRVGCCMVAPLGRDSRCREP